MSALFKLEKVNVSWYKNKTCGLAAHHLGYFLLTKLVQRHRGQLPYSCCSRLNNTPHDEFTRLHVLNRSIAPLLTNTDPLLVTRDTSTTNQQRIRLLWQQLHPTSQWTHRHLFWAVSHVQYLPSISRGSVDTKTLWLISFLDAMLTSVSPTLSDIGRLAGNIQLFY